jgi:hypothetical protein
MVAGPERHAAYNRNKERPWLDILDRFADFVEQNRRN